MQIDNAASRALARQRLGSLEFPVTVVLGQTRMRIRDLMKLAAGSMIELDRQEGELAEFVVRGVVVARGEVVSIGGNYGLQIVNVISREERVALQSKAAARARRNVMHSFAHRKP